MDCEERHPGCHDTCGTYQEAKEEYHAKKNARYKQKAAEADYMSYKVKSIDDRVKNRQPK